MASLRMFSPRRVLFITLLFGFLVAHNQELPPIHNFTPFDYGSGNQNWDISQSDDKIVFVANNEGLLEFNGATWTLYPSPNETIMRSVKVINDRVYTGCYKEFGYWERNSLGVLKYHSISQNAAIELIEDEEFWNIINVDDWIVFQSLKRIYLYNTQTTQIRIIDSNEVINKMFEIDESIYFQRLNRGIFQIENGNATIFIDHPLLNSSEVINMISYEKGFLIITKDDGLYRLENGNLTRWKNENGIFSNLGIYSAIQLKNNRIALGTISYGLIILDQNFEILHIINQNNGLQNNTVLSLFEDRDRNIWAGLDNGICYINIEAPIKIFKDTKGIIGSVYSTAIYDGNLYLGTNQGLFYKPYEGKEEFRLIEGTQGQVWRLIEIDGLLFCGHHNGTFIISDKSARKICDVQGTWDINRINDKSELIIQGNYDGLYVLEMVNGTWKLRNKIEGFNNSSRYFEVFGEQIFVNHEYKGVFNLRIDENYRQVIDLKIDTLFKGANSGISKYQEEILYVSAEGIFKYNTVESAFERDSLLSKAYSREDYISGRIVLSKNGERFWLFTKPDLILFTSGGLSEAPRIIKIPISQDVRREVSEYENIISTNVENQFLLGTSSGYMTINIDDLIISDFDVYIDQISNGINDDHSATKNLLEAEVKGYFGSDENNLLISFHTPAYYEYFLPTYQYQLVGLYDIWSEWTTQPEVFFENIPPGEYTFNVRSKVGNKLSDNIASYSFSISRPWYFTDFMIGVYILGVILFSIFMHHLYRGYYKSQQEKLIERNKKELELAKLQNERDIINLKNEQLQQDYRAKSNEAAASAMSIVKKNELLMQIKDHLLHINDKQSLAPVIKIINKNLDHDENWKLFKEAFDNSDSEFFKKLKEMHPDLSPNDLKLCAYLRLNLSSKEIAPLFNISPRSVEIKRYRLRRKMNLENNENLTEYILNL
ncbi:MAG: triple tyrosine motif-containing protein [Bacteroidota bacterium]